MDTPKNAAFRPETIAVMDDALRLSIATLPEPVSSSTVHQLAKSILHNAKDGTTDPKDLSRLALLEMQLR